MLRGSARSDVSPDFLCSIFCENGEKLVRPVSYNARSRRGSEGSHGPLGPWAESREEARGVPGGGPTMVPWSTGRVSSSGEPGWSAVAVDTAAVTAYCIRPLDQAHSRVTPF